MAIVLNDIVRVSFGMQTEGVGHVNVHHFQLTSLGSNGTDQAVADAVLEGWLQDNVIDTGGNPGIPGPWKDIYTSQTQAVCARMQKILPDKEISFFRTLAGVGNNQGGGDRMPAHCAVMIRWWTAGAGRGSTGRTYTAAPPKNTVNEGRLENVAIPQWELYMQKFLGTQNGGNGLTMIPVLYSPTLNTFSPIVAGELDPIVRSQRQRSVTIC